MTALSCPVCSKPATGVTEERVPPARRLCDPHDETREPGSRWRRYEPCGHVQQVAESTVPTPGEVWLSDEEDAALAEWWVREGGDYEDLAIERLTEAVELILAARVSDRLPQPSERPWCRDCGPGYRLGDDGCRHDDHTGTEGETGICRTCALPIWWETGQVGHIDRLGWSDRIARGGDSLVCFKAMGYRHVPMGAREEAIYRAGVKAGLAQAELPPVDLAAVLAEHEACRMNDSRDGHYESAVNSAEDVWSCEIRLPFAETLEDADRAHMAAAIREALEEAMSR